MTIKASIPRSRMNMLSSPALMGGFPPGEVRAATLPAVARGVYKLKGFF
jgi:hypothetical protein